MHRKRFGFSFVGTPRPNDTLRAISTLFLDYIILKKLLQPFVDILAKGCFYISVLDGYFRYFNKLFGYRREESVALEILLDTGNINSVGDVYRLYVYLLASAYKYLLIFIFCFSKIYRLFKRRSSRNVFSCYAQGRGYYYVKSTVERLSYFAISIGAHDNGISPSQGFEPFHIFFELPRKFSVFADYAVFRYRCYNIYHIYIIGK